MVEKSRQAFFMYYGTSNFVLPEATSLFALDLLTGCDEISDAEKVKMSIARKKSTVKKPASEVIFKRFKQFRFLLSNLI